MSLENDIKQILEAENPFKGADPTEIEKRKEELLKQYKDKLIPVLPKIMKLNSEMWTKIVELENSLRVLSNKYNSSDGECQCNTEVLEILGQDDEFTEIPAEDGYTKRLCLRCGGWRDTF